MLYRRVNSLPGVLSRRPGKQAAGNRARERICRRRHAGQSPVSAVLQGNNLLVHYIFFQVQGSDQFNNTIYIANQPTLAYFEAGQTPNFYVGIKPSAVIFDQLTITGYLVDLTQ
jgi:hypothetical protein